MAVFATMIDKLKRVHALAGRIGWTATLGWVWKRLKHGPSKPGLIDIFAHYEFVVRKDIKPILSHASQKTINWFIPDFNIGSGGHLNIFRTIWHLEQRGYESTIVIVRPMIHHNADHAQKQIVTHFFPLKAKVLIGLNALPSSEFAVATGWDTAYTVRDFTGAAHKIYFVQDFEPEFYPVGSEWILANNTYQFGFYGITAGNWLAVKLQSEYKMATHAVGFGVEHERYQPVLRREPEVKRVFFYARPPTPRRAFEIGLLILNAVWQKMPDTEFILAGWDTAGYNIPFPHLACGTVALDALPDLYGQCDVALVLSLTNISLLPLELMACGCAVVSNSGPNVDWLLNDQIAVLVNPNPEDMTTAICELLVNNDRRKAMTERAQIFAATQNWTNVALQFEHGLEKARLYNSNRAAACVA